MQLFGEAAAQKITKVPKNVKYDRTIDQSILIT